jgi:uracil-DNA glycosylase
LRAAGKLRKACHLEHGFRSSSARARIRDWRMHEAPKIEAQGIRLPTGSTDASALANEVRFPESRVLPVRERCGRNLSPMRIELKHGKEESQGELTLMPPASDLIELRKEASKCQACPLYLNATQTVFGEGGRGGVVFIGEQPGDQEDKAGKPFVGPAGQILDQALKVAGIDRSQCYVTNAVKHFKWKPSGKRRIHEKPSAREIEACRPWLVAELQFLRPETIICLGASATRSVFGKDLPILKNRGRWMSSDLSPKTLITVHPSSILRAPDPAAREKAFADFVADLDLVAESLDSSG